MSFEHRCNAYCTDTEHCELIYTSEMTPEVAQGRIRQALGFHRGLRVTRVEPAPEAPPLGTVPMCLDTLQGEPSDASRWLVWWR